MRSGRLPPQGLGVALTRSHIVVSASLGLVTALGTLHARCTSLPTCAGIGLAGMVGGVVVFRVVQPILWRGMARFLSKFVNAAYAHPWDLRPTSLDRFPAADKAFYERATRELAEEGFVALVDFENASWRDGVCIRVLVNSQTRLRAEICQRKHGCVDLLAELSDGRWLVTSNTPGPSSATTAHAVSYFRKAVATTVRELLASHRTSVESELRAKPTLTLLVPASLEAALEQTQRFRVALSAEFMKAGIMTRPE